MTTAADTRAVDLDADGGPGSDPGPGDEAVVIRLGQGRFAVALSAVGEVGRVPAVTRVPGLPSWVAGVANWRGRILAVLDLRTLLGAAAVDPGPRARLLVVTQGTVSVGLLVDAVESTTLLPAEVAAYPSALPSAAAGLLSGQVPFDDGPVAVLDATAVLRLRDGLPRGRRSA